MDAITSILPLLLGYILDLLLGDPDHWPHPVKLFGTLIYKGEKWLNIKALRFFKGAVLTVFLCVTCFVFFSFTAHFLLQVNKTVYILFATVFVYFGLANKGLISEGRKVFDQLDQHGLEAGRMQVSRIVGRDTSQLSAQQIRIAVFETMSENLSDGVIAPLFYYAIAGVPGMMTYKMINTLDSMIGYRSERYEYFGKFAARLDDVVNFIPSRLTALLMPVVSFSKRGWAYIFRYGHQHKSPNSGYPEAALAGIINARFGGPNIYHGQLIHKPFIGANERIIQHQEIQTVSRINHRTCLGMIILLIIFSCFQYLR